MSVERQLAASLVVLNAVDEDGVCLEVSQAIESDLQQARSSVSGVLAPSVMTLMVGAAALGGANDVAAGPPPPGVVDDLFGDKVGEKVEEEPAKKPDGKVKLVPEPVEKVEPAEPKVETKPKKPTAVEVVPKMSFKEALRHMRIELGKLPNLKTRPLDAQNFDEVVAGKKPNIFMLSGSKDADSKWLDPLLAHLEALYAGKIQTIKWDYDTGDASVSRKLPSRVIENVRYEPDFRDKDAPTIMLPNNPKIPAGFHFEGGKANALFKGPGVTLVSMMHLLEVKFGIKASKEIMQKALTVMAMYDGMSIDVMNERAAAIKAGKFEGDPLHIDTLWAQIDPNLKDSASLISLEDMYCDYTVQGSEEDAKKATFFMIFLSKIDKRLQAGSFTKRVAIELARRNPDKLFDQTMLKPLLSNKSGIGFEMLEAAAEVYPEGLLLSFDSIIGETVMKSLSEENLKRMKALIAKVKSKQGGKTTPE